MPTIEKRSSTEEREYNKKLNKATWLPNLLLFLTVCASAGSAFYSRRAAQEATRQANDADGQLTQVKLQTAQAILQAEASAQSAPRSWLSIEFNNRDPVVEKKPIGNGLQNIWITVPFTIHNFGALPARIDNIEARMIIPADAYFPDEPPKDINNVGKHLNISRIDHPNIIFNQAIGHTILAQDAKPLSITAPSFFFHGQPDLLWPIFPNQWIYMHILYRDPYGVRNYCVYAKARFDFPLVSSSGYNDCK